jgi:catechol 2,3-dioxygenase-like lactoylglutathione lyase family enzyme
MISVDCINHTSIAVNDVERAKQFYTELLGLKEIVDTRTKSFPPGYKLPPDPLFITYGNDRTKHPCRLECGGVEVTLFERPVALDPEEVIRSRGIFHYSFRMDFGQVKAMCNDTASLRKQGYRLPFEPEALVLPGGITYWRLYIMDPDGNLIEIVGWPPQNADDAAGSTGHPGK